MKALIRFVFILGAFFTATLLLFKAFDVLTVEDIKQWLTDARHAPVWITGLIISGLLIIDLFIAIPTLSLTILSGFFLGLEFGILFSTTGMVGAGTMGYLISRYKGDWLLRKVSGSEEQLLEMKELFHSYGPVALTLCRATPMLPEITSCLAGVTRMPYWKYLLFYLIGTVPYAIIAVYAGSISTVDDPEPAVFTFLAMFGILGLVWFSFLFLKRKELIGTKR